MPDALASWAVSAGRMLLGGVFVVGGLRHLPILPAVSEAMRARGVPFPRLAMAIGTAFQIAAGGLLMAGLFVGPAALGLIIFTIAAGILALDFWNKAGPERATAINIWQSNAAIIGGLLVAASTSS